MRPIIALRIGTLAWVILTIALVMLLIGSVFAAVQKPAKACGDSAYNHYKTNGYDKMGCGANIHYNKKLSACFLHVVCSSDHGKNISEYVEDIGKGRNQARYINTSPSSSSGSCMVNGKECRNYYEFLDLIRPYMEN
jgi:hypothetical protein